VRHAVFPIVLLVAAGILFLFTSNGFHHRRFWEIYLVNLLFWTGISQAGVVFSAVIVLTRALWWRPVRRIAEGLAMFLPVSLLLFVVFFLGGRDLYPWARSSGTPHYPWLDWTPLVIRDLAGVALLHLLSFIFIVSSIRAGNGSRGGHRFVRVLSPILIVVYAVVYSLLAIDLVMSLAPEWYSTLFGGYFFIGNLYAGLAFLGIFVVLHRGSGSDHPVTANTLHDIGKLLLAFCLITGDFFWSQFLVIWYGNLPEETAFILRRIDGTHWAGLTWSVLLVAFILPFLILLSRRVKIAPAGLLTVSAIVVVGMWLERYVLIIPSVYDGESFPLGGTEIATTLGFLSLFLLARLVGDRFLPRDISGKG
jgi:Ni/Fe-hydrogenase subunit HybB-like protein